MSDQVELQLVYGKISDYELVFIPQHQAVELARLHHALLLAATWGELKQSTTEARWREAVSAARDEDDQDPGDDDPFDTDELASYCDGDCPEWPAQGADWMAADLQARFDERGTSVLKGDYLVIDPACEAPLVGAMRDAGYVCKRDDLLVQAASGR